MTTFGFRTLAKIGIIVCTLMVLQFGPLHVDSTDLSGYLGRDCLGTPVTCKNQRVGSCCTFGSGAQSLLVSNLDWDQRADIYMDGCTTEITFANGPADKVCLQDPSGRLFITGAAWHYIGANAENSTAALGNETKVTVAGKVPTANLTDAMP